MRFLIRCWDHTGQLGFLISDLLEEICFFYLFLFIFYLFLFFCSISIFHSLRYNLIIKVKRASSELQ